MFDGDQGEKSKVEEACEIARHEWNGHERIHIYDFDNLRSYG